jgi:hypothetical protein
LLVVKRGPLNRLPVNIIRLSNERRDKIPFSERKQPFPGVFYIQEVTVVK